MKEVSNTQLTNVWKKISDKPLPDVGAFTLSDKDFFFLLNQVQKNQWVKDTRVKEYGLEFDNKYIEAFSFKARKRFFILIRQSVPLAASIEHELRHILAEDLST